MKAKKNLGDFVRTPKTTIVPLNELKLDPNWKRDDRFVDLYLNFLKGKLSGFATRVELASVVAGRCCKKDDGSFEYADVATPKDRHIEWEKKRIRAGFRPSLVIYKAYVGPAKGRFLCSDDLISYFAYQQLGIKKIPVLILGKHVEMLSESAIILRSQGKAGDPQFHSMYAHKPKMYQTFFGAKSNFLKRNPYTALKTLDGQVERVATAIKKFHRGGDEEIFYHHTIYSVIFRLKEAIHAAKLLLENEMYFQIRPLVRSTYDILLNFYVDWLAPEKVGPLLQCLAAINGGALSDQQCKELRALVREKWGALADICQNQFEKGRLSPLSSEVHKRIYSSLSPAVHQDFGVAHDYGYALETGKPRKMRREELMSNIRWLDLVVSAIVARIADDIGLEMIPERNRS